MNGDGCCSVVIEWLEAHLGNLGVLRKHLIVMGCCVYDFCYSMYAWIEKQTHVLILWTGLFAKSKVETNVKKSLRLYFFYTQNH